MEVTEIGGSSGYQAHLQIALDDAVSAYEEIHQMLSLHPPLTEDTATLELTLLHYTLEQRRATALVLAGCCVEAVANLYLAHKTTPGDFSLLSATSISRRKNGDMAIFTSSGFFRFRRSTRRAWTTVDGSPRVSQKPPVVLMN